VKRIAVKPKYVSEFCLTEVGGLLKNCLKNRLQIAGRGADDLEHFGGRRLPLKSQLKLARAPIKTLSQIDR
jgi:hypothetical protein